MARIRYCLHCGHELTLQKINGKEYLACPAKNCEYVFWDNPLPVVAAVVEHEGNVLLARNKAWPPKMFGLITGFLEKRESPENAVLREVREELGIDAGLEGMIGVYPFPEQNQIIIAYHVSAQGEIAMGDELAEVISVPPDKVRPWALGAGPALKDWLERLGIKGS
ncbi:MAG: NUDIX domain-containing protein [Deltaproteobacteria bacterium]|nr:NUDIX domain-containing protein [Deltaproteobacteria bacterium]